MERKASKYDVVIVGGGPAGIFAALELCQACDLSILLLEKGKDIDSRDCPFMEKGISCPPCSPCDLVSGLGGAGAYSDGKLTLSAEVGGRLRDYLGPERTEDLIRYVDSIYLKFGGSDRVYGSGEQVEELGRRATLADLRLIPMTVRHLGTERSRDVLRGIRDFLSGRVEVKLGEVASTILTENGTVKGIETKDGQKFECCYLIIAPGREGADWLVREAERLRLTLQINPIDVGVRVEVPEPVLRELTDALYECKLEYYSKAFDDRVRTFCMCPAGEVTMESTGGSDPVTTVNGHSYAERKTSNTNFALLVSTTFTESFRDPIAYGRDLARLANILSGGVILQRLGDLQPTLKGATPGDLSFALPYRHLKSIIEMLGAMDRLAPGVASRHTLLYGIEVKFYSSRLALSDGLESEIVNMFAAGDGAGVTRGLVQASASGVVAAREIMKRAGVATHS
ncbi:MAG: FAD-dependent oxidoreductase [Dehalococcoidia bacterium DG_18]|nr:MAG: FAD-dependent oxidoreductase [Dehalococcoidia bacterium DG_18]